MRKWLSPRLFLTARCQLYRVAELPNGDRRIENVAANVPCRLIRQSINRITSPSIQGGQENLRGFYRLVLSRKASEYGEFGYAKIDGVMYAVVSKSTERWTDHVSSVYNVEETNWTPTEE